MKKLFALSLVLLLVSCGNAPNNAVSTGQATATAGGQAPTAITVQSVLARIGKKGFKDGELIVRYKSGRRVSAASRMRGALGTRTMRDLPMLGAEQVGLPRGLTVRDAITLYMQDPDVEYAEPNYIRSVRATVPNDPLFRSQWALSNRTVSGADMHMPQAWDIISGNNGLVVAVVDTGIDYTHADLSGNVWTNPGEPDCSSAGDNDHNGYTADCRGWNFVAGNNDPADDDGHGTHVSGIIGAVGNHGVGIAGVLWNVKIMPLKVLDAEGEGTVADEASAIEYAIANGARIINASFAGDSFSNLEKNAIAAANDAGILFVTAAGNGDANSVGSNNDAVPVYPADYNLPNIIAVAATDQADRLASFSNYGKNSVQVAAPGVDILSTVPVTLKSSFCGGSPVKGYEYCSGTSMSTPHITGLAGLIEGVFPNFSYQQVRATIIRYVDQLPTLQGLTVSGGRANAYNALSSLLGPDGLSAVAGSSSSITLAWTDHATGEDGYVVERKKAGGDFQEIGRTGQDVTTYADSQGLQPSTLYTYRVSAFNTIPASSAYSNEASATTEEGPQPVPPSSGGGGGGCSVGAGGQASAADLIVYLLPLVLLAGARRLHRREKKDLSQN